MAINTRLLFGDEYADGQEHKMSLGRHFKKVCQYGQIHGQCRCMAPNKDVEKVECNIGAHATIASNWKFLETYDEATLFKVRDALGRAGLSEELVNNSINEMQNAGIMFRERA